nr:MAG TPA: hypothetical protein [Caudoviricetes sp.]
MRFRLMNILDDYLGTCFVYLGNSFFAMLRKTVPNHRDYFLLVLYREMVNDQNKMFYKIIYMGFGDSV